MDLDHNGVSQVIHTSRGESEAVVSDMESPTVEELPISTLSIGHSTEIQTEKVVDLAPETTYVKIKEPGKVVTHTLWGFFTSSNSTYSWKIDFAAPPHTKLRDWPFWRSFEGP